jgi:protoporphyrinogen/coproporphyrinogen III oxidase
MADVIILGAGITGLSCAWTLRKLGIEATILESSSRAGGVIRTEIVNGYHIEWGPNSFQPAPQALNLIEEAGLWEDLQAPNPHSPRYVYLNGRLRKFPFGPLGFTGLLRILGEPLVRSKARPEESVRDFFSRRFGAGVHDRLVAPLLTGMYAADTAQLSMTATFPRIIEMEREYGSLAGALLRALTGRSKTLPSEENNTNDGPSKRRPRGSLFSFPTGMETLPARLAENASIQFRTKDARLSDAPATVVTVPAYAASDVVAKQQPALAKLLNRIEYSPMVVAASALPEHSFPRPLHGFGFLAPRSQGLHILGTLFSSAVFPGRAPAGHVLLTTFIGGAFEPEAVDWPDDRIWEIVSAELQRVLQSSEPPHPVALYRHRAAIPQYRIGHEVLVASIKDELKNIPGLFVTGSYLEGISVPACIAQGVQTARAVGEYLRRPSS